MSNSCCGLGAYPLPSWMGCGTGIRSEVRIFHLTLKQAKTLNEKGKVSVIREGRRVTVTMANYIQSV